MKKLSKSVNNGLHKFLLASLATTCLVTSPSFAENAYILQLGSFGTKDEAQKRWDDLQSKNGDILKGLKLHIAEISMSGDDKISYRTQAGPVDSHATAEKLCDKLQGKGEDCFVVETAMMDSDLPVASSAPAAEPEVKKEVAATPKPETLPEPVKSVDADAAKPDTSTVKFLDDSNAPVAKPAASAEPKKAEDAAPTKTAEAAPAEKPARNTVKFLDDDSTPAAKPVETAKAEEKPAPAPAPAPAAEQKTSDAPVASRGKKFLDSGDSAETKTAAAEPSKAEDVEVIIIPNAPDDELEAPTKTSKGKVAEVATKDTGKTIAVSSKVVGSSGIAYVAGREPKFLDDEPAPVAAAPAVKEVSPKVEVAQDIAPAETKSPAKEKPGFFGRLFGSSTKEEAKEEPTKTSGEETKVSVAEAIRVPLTKGDGAKSSVVANPDVLDSAPIYWAQINYFDNEEKAHHFYEGFRSAHPELADELRMRITHPFVKEKHVTLRVGAFTSAGLKTICDMASQHNLSCTSVQEKEIAIAESGKALSHEQASDTNAIVSAAKAAAETPMTYWIQFGTYNSEDAAMGEWKDIKKSHKKLIGKSEAFVTTPDDSTASNGKSFRLRTGPYSSKESADELCSKLAKDGANCLVVGEH